MKKIHTLHGNEIKLDKPKERRYCLIERRLVNCSLNRDCIDCKQEYNRNDGNN